MPLTPLAFAPDRVEFSGLLTLKEISALADMTSLRTLQFDSPVHRGNWRLLEEGLFRRRPDVCLRAYGHYTRNCDVSFVKQMPSLQDFKADSLQRASGLQALEGLPNLRHLSIGIDELDSFEFLAGVSTHLNSLILGPTLSTKPDVSVLSRFKKMEEVFIGGHLKGLSVLSSLPSLGKIRFSGLKSPDLDFLSKMPNLWFLEILLGGSEDFSAIAGATGLKHLEIAWVRRLKDISFISQCKNLQQLTLDRLRQVEHLPNFETLTNLRRLTISDLKGLRSVDPIGASPTLEILSGSAGLLLPEQFRVALQAPSLRRATIYFNSQKKKNEFDTIAAEYNVERC